MTDAGAGDDVLRFALCRSMGHEWHHGRPVGIDDPDAPVARPYGMSTGMVGLPSTCGECAMERVRWVTRSGEVVTRYRQPDGYARHGDDRLAPQEWRRLHVASLFDEVAAPRRSRRKARR